MERFQKRRRFTSSDKAQIVKSVLKDKKAVSEVCEQNEIAVSQYYNWQSEALSRLHRVFEDEKGDNVLRKTQAENEELKRNLEQKTKFMFELMEEHVKLKKRLGVS